MSGPRNVGQVTDSITTGSLSTQTALINFAVPSVQTLSTFNIGDFDIPAQISPGVIEPILDTLGKTCNEAFLLCADGKKVTAGVDAKGGDVNMFGYEGGIPLDVRESTYQNEKQLLDHLVSLFGSIDGKNELTDCNFELKESLSTPMKSIIEKISARIKESRNLIFKQTLGLNKFINIAGENWRESRYVYVISGLQASLFQLKEFLQTSLNSISSYGVFVSQMQNSVSAYRKSSELDKSYQQNMLTLVETDETSDVEPRYIKQRSELWHLLRNQARVTGSSLHSAIGLRGVKEQKQHYEHFIDKKEHTFSKSVQERLQHGTDNEINAVATLVGRFLPIYYPRSHFVEEGCYVLPGKHTDILGEVSPDGSIRLLDYSETESPTIGNAIAAVEIKCPFPTERSLPVHYSLPEYYVAQCLAEMFVLQTNILIFVSYSKESTAFHEVHFDAELWEEIWNEALDLYDLDQPIKLTRSRPKSKSIKVQIASFVKTNVNFLCEIPSIQMIDSGLSHRISNSRFEQAWPVDKTEQKSTVEDVIMATNSTKTVIGNGYNLMRRKATEVMVWVLTNKDRNSSVEIPCSLPIAYGLKDYKLSSKEMRDATEYVLRKCHEKGIHVVGFYTDGQWMPLMHRDGSGSPLTILQLHKDVWEDSKSLSKPELIRRISKLNRSTDQDPLDHICCIKEVNGSLIAEGKDVAFDKIKTNLDKKLWNPKSKTVDENMEVSASTVTDTASEWLPETVIEEIRNTEDVRVQHIIEEVSTEAIETDSDSPMLITDGGLESLFEEQKARSIDDNPEIETASQEEYESQPTVVSSNEAVERNKLDLTLKVVTDILDALKSNLKTKKKWLNAGSERVYDVLSADVKVRSLSHLEINVIYDTIRPVIDKQFQVFKKSWKKDEKVAYMSGILGISGMETINVVQKRVKLKTPLSLSKLATKVLSAKKFPKVVLRSAYTAYTFPTKLSVWQGKAPIQCPTKIQGIDKPVEYWFSYPELHEGTTELLGKGIDCSHNFTHLRVRTCTTGICGVSAEAWKACARSNQTILKIPLVEDLIDKQSVPNARTNFCEDVEEWMRSNGFESAADLTRLIRNWYSASDDSGIYAIDRIRYLLEMRDFLLEGVDFSTYPPVGRYIKGIPIVTYEGLLMDIDTKLQMYSIVGPYNIRSVGSLAAETTVGVLQALYPINQVSIKARDVPGLMTSVVEVMTCKLDPDRYIYS